MYGPTFKVFDEVVWSDQNGQELQCSVLKKFSKDKVKQEFGPGPFIVCDVYDNDPDDCLCGRPIDNDNGQPHKLQAECGELPVQWIAVTDKKTGKLLTPSFSSDWFTKAK